MPFFWQKSDGDVRHVDADMAAQEKLIGEPELAQRLTDEEAHIINNLVELHLIDPSEQEDFLRRKKNQAGISLDERRERRAPAAEGCPILRLAVREPAVSVGSLLLHVLAVLCAVMGRRFLNQSREVLKANQLGASENDYVHHEYMRFWKYGAADVLPLLIVPMVWLGIQYVARMFRRSVAPMLNSVYEITMIVLCIYFPSVPVARDGYKWQEVLDTFGSNAPRIDLLSMLARQYKLTGLLFVYPIAAIYLVLITTRILTAVATLARGTATPGTVLYWLHRRGHTAASGLYLITAILSAVGASMNIWNGLWYSWHQDLENITATWISSGFPFQTILFIVQVVAFLALAVAAVAGDSLPPKLCRRFSISMACWLSYTVLMGISGVIAMDKESKTWAAETTKPRHIAAISMAAIVAVIHGFIVLCPALTRQVNVETSVEV
ncbi:hypothetical protein V494_04622 [Pseudogymnoascus sp. VKM F-4513 (FW-928)]|nr:hypothetical protein V494_04622 [Pseudogymnoascus sp. VKM F-4513 (FW-928)]